MNRNIHGAEEGADANGTGANAYDDLRAVLHGELSAERSRRARHLIDAMERGDHEREAEVARLREALRAVWDDMRGVDKHCVPNNVIALVRAAIGDELGKYDPASHPSNGGPSPSAEPGPEGS